MANDATVALNAYTKGKKELDTDLKKKVVTGSSTANTATTASHKAQVDNAAASKDKIKVHSVATPSATAKVKAATVKTASNESSISAASAASAASADSESEM